jgi:hypothetical protein
MSSFVFAGDVPAGSIEIKRISLFIYFWVAFFPAARCRRCGSTKRQKMDAGWERPPANLVLIVAQKRGAGRKKKSTDVKRHTTAEERPAKTDG